MTSGTSYFGFILALASSSTTITPASMTVTLKQTSYFGASSTTIYLYTYGCTLNADGTYSLSTTIGSATTGVSVTPIGLFGTPSYETHNINVPTAVATNINYVAFMVYSSSSMVFGTYGTTVSSPNAKINYVTGITYANNLLYSGYPLISTTLIES